MLRTTRIAYAIPISNALALARTVNGNEIMISSTTISESVSKITVHMIFLIKKGLWTVILLLIINNVSAQDSKSSKLCIGIEIGPSITTLYGDPYYNYQTFPACGVSGGLAFQVFINKYLSFKTSYLFQLKVEKTEDINSTLVH